MSSAAARSTFVFHASPRRLPEMPRTFIDLRGLDEVELGGELDVVRERRLAGRERHVPVETEIGAVDGDLEREVQPLVPERVGRRVGERAAELDRAADALDRDLALDDEPVALARHLRRREADLGRALDVEEL